MEDNRKKALAAALGQIEKQFGKGSVMRLGDAPSSYDVEAVSTGSLGLDIALGIGGLPRGRVVEIFGPESSGKTTLSLQVIAEVQRAGGTAAFVDAEHALDPAYAGKLGVNITDLLVSQPDTGEQALEITDMLVRSNAVDIVVIDSVAALTPKAEIEGEMGEMQMGLHARLMSQALRKLTGNISRSNTIVVFINQIRMKIGVMFGNPETTTGGNALKFYASVRLDIRRIGAIKNGEEVTGNMTRVKVVKNKVAPPFREAEFEIMYGQGISREGEIIELASAQGIIEKSGAWYAYKGNRIGQGKDNARAYLLANKEVAREIEEQVRARLLPPRQERRTDQAARTLPELPRLGDPARDPEPRRARGSAAAAQPPDRAILGQDHTGSWPAAQAEAFSGDRWTAGSVRAPTWRWPAFRSASTPPPCCMSRRHPGASPADLPGDRTPSGRCASASCSPRRESACRFDRPQVLRAAASQPRSQSPKSSSRRQPARE